MSYCFFEQILIITVVLKMLTLNYWINSTHYPSVFAANFEQVLYVACFCLNFE